MLIDLVPSLAGAAIRSVGLSLVASAGLLVFRVRSSSARHATWTVVLVGMLLQLPLGVLAPAIELNVPSFVHVLAQPVRPPRVMQSTPASASAAPAPESARATRTLPQRRWSPAEAVSDAYLLISMLLLLRTASGQWALCGILRGARRIAGLGPGIYESEVFVVPGATGCFRRKIILPAHWRNWNTAQLQAVLAHERAHVRRQDWLICFASHLNICLYWFHPLAWWIRRELARLAEEACDDVALSETRDRDEYAATLVDIARTAAACGGLLNRAAVSMARDSGVLQRVNRILNQGVAISRPFGRLGWIALVANGLPVIYLSAALQLTPANRNPASSGHIAAPEVPAETDRPVLPKIQSPVRLTAQMAPKPARPPRTAAPYARGKSSLTMCIVIDYSGSMRNKREAAKTAALALIEASQPSDKVCVLDFNDEVYNDLPRGEDFTSDPGEMQQSLTHIDSRGGKAMRDAVRMAISQLRQTTNGGRKIVVLITEGNDSSSVISQERLIAEVRDSGVRIYAIGLAGDDNPLRSAAAREALGQLANASGGLDYYPKDAAEVEIISSEVANEIHKE